MFIDDLARLLQLVDRRLCQHVAQQNGRQVDAIDNVSHVVENAGCHFGFAPLPGGQDSVGAATSMSPSLSTSRLSANMT